MKRAALNFFEEVGLLVKDGALDEDTAWTLFCSDVADVHEKTHEAIARLQRDRNDFTIWEDFLQLHARLQEIDTQQRRRTLVRLLPSMSRSRAR